MTLILEIAAGIVLGWSLIVQPKKTLAILATAVLVVLALLMLILLWAAYPHGPQAPITAVILGLLFCWSLPKLHETQKGR